jgi:uncharacterized RDD family membrane protein YckC
MATPAQRLISFLIDSAILMPPMMLVAWALGVPPGFKPVDAQQAVGLFGLNHNTAKLASTLVRAIVYDVYFGALAVALGASLGKRMLGLRWVDQQGRPISHGRARGHYWACLLAILPFGLGLIVMLFDRQKRGWHDKLAGVWFVKPEFVRPAELPPVERDPAAVPPGMGGHR